VKRPTIAIIGGGIFGVATALELANSYDVTIFEQSNGLLTGATYANHNRHHYGFHYPRSPETALQCLACKESFETIYGKSLVWDFSNYYCIAKNNTKTTPKKYIEFCKELNLSFEEVWPADGILNRNKIALCLRVKEAVYDFNILKEMILYRLSSQKYLKVLLNSRVLGGCSEDNQQKTLFFSHTSDSKKIKKAKFNFVINATYGGYNCFCEWFNFEKRLCQFNLQELDIIRLPGDPRIGITVQDGPFPSFLPLGTTNQYLLAHVISSQLIRESTYNTVPLMQRNLVIETNWESIQRTCSKYIPILRNARYIRSILVDRVVDATKLEKDARLTEVTNHGKGCWSIFSAKVITCVKVAQDLRAQIERVI
jgi:hypothetical protein